MLEASWTGSGNLCVQCSLQTVQSDCCYWCVLGRCCQAHCWASAQSCIQLSLLYCYEMQGLDIGPDSLKAFQESLADCGTIIWTGGNGVFEFEKFAKGTFGLAHMLGGAFASMQDGTLIVLLAPLSKRIWGCHCQ